MCARSKKVIPRLLRRIRELEARIEDEMYNEVDMSGSLGSSLRMRSTMEGEFSSRLRNNGKMMESVRWVMLGMLILAVDVFLGNML